MPTSTRPSISLPCLNPSQGKKKISLKKNGSSASSKTKEAEESPPKKDTHIAKTAEQQEATDSSEEVSTEKGERPNSENTSTPEASEEEDLAGKEKPAVSNINPPGVESGIVAKGNTARFGTSKMKGTVKVPRMSDVVKKVKQGDADAAEQEDGPKRNTPYTKEQVLTHWEEFKNRIAEEGKDRQVSIMKQPKELEGDVIRLKLGNLLQQDLLDKFRTELMEYLRNKLNNDLIHIEVTLEEQKSEKKLYTNQEKLSFLKEKYPDLEKLQKRLGLDPDF